MSIFDKIPNLLNLNKISAPNKSEELNNVKTSFVTTPIQLYPFSGTDMTTFRSAILSARNEITPNRLPLLKIYKQFETDAKLKSLVYKRKANILNKRRTILFNNKEIDANWVETNWFRHFLDIAMDSVFWGFSAPYFGNIVNGEFEWVKGDIIQYVSPEKRLLGQTPYIAVGTGKSIDDPEVAKSLILICNQPYDLGIYESLIPLLILKNVALSGMANASKEIATVYKSYKSDKKKQSELDNLYYTVSQMLESGQIIMSKEDSLEILANPQIGDSIDFYIKALEYYDKCMALVILGQTMTSENGSSRAQAQVHKQTEDDIMLADCNYIENIINTQLIPFLKSHSFNIPDGITFKFDNSDEIDATGQFDIEIELLKSGKYDIPAEYFKRKYNIDVTDSKQPFSQPETKVNAAPEVAATNFRKFSDYNKC